MEAYSVGRLFQIFNDHKPQMNDTDKLRLAETIVNALIDKTKTYALLKVAFWKILWNLHLKESERKKNTRRFIQW